MKKLLLIGLVIIPFILIQAGENVRGGKDLFPISKINQNSIGVNGHISAGIIYDFTGCDPCFYFHYQLIISGDTIYDIATASLNHYSLKKISRNKFKGTIYRRLNPGEDLIFKLGIKLKNKGQPQIITIATLNNPNFLTGIVLPKSNLRPTPIQDERYIRFQWGFSRETAATRVYIGQSTIPNQIFSSKPFNKDYIDIQTIKFNKDSGCGLGIKHNKYIAEVDNFSLTKYAKSGSKIDLDSLISFEFKTDKNYILVPKY